MAKKKLADLIPKEVRIKAKVKYEILYTDEFLADKNQLGECRPDTKQIVISNNQSDTEKFSTAIHEIIHSMNFESETMGLTERQVIALEQSILRFLKLNKYV